MSAVKLASGYIELTVKAGQAMKEVVAQVNEIEKAAKKASEAAGDAINEGLTDGARKGGKAVKDEITAAAKKAGEDAGRAAGDGISKGTSKGAKDAGKVIKDEVTAAGRKAGQDAGEAISEGVSTRTGRLSGIFKELGSQAAQGIKDGIADVGGLSAAADGLAEHLRAIGQSGAADTVERIGHVAGPMADAFTESKKSIEGTSTSLMSLVGNEGKISGALAGISRAAGPLAAVFEGLKLMPGAMDAINGSLAQLQGKKDFNPWDWAHSAIPGLGLVDNAMGYDHDGHYKGGGIPGFFGAHAPRPAPVAPPLPPRPESEQQRQQQLLEAYLPAGLRRGGTAGVSSLGRIFGPGTGTSDSILGVGADGIPTALVSNGEGVVRKSAMDRGAAPIVAALNGGWNPDALRGILPGYDDGTTDVGGGNVPTPQIRVPEANTGQAGTFNQWLQSQQGKQYQYGTLYDCSGFMSQVYNQLTGRQMPRFNTESDLAAYGFVRGSKPGTFQLGIHHGGGGPNSHMAGTLPDGRNVESGGSGVQIGAGAHGAFDPQFEDHWYLPGSEGLSGAGGLGRSMLLGMPGTGVESGAAPTGATPGRTEGYIPAGAGGSGQAGTSFASGLLNMGAEAINGLIDQAASAASTAVAAGIAGGTFGAGAVGGSQAGAAAAQAALGLGTNAAKRGVKFGFQMAGIGIDSLAEILMPFGVPRLFNTDPTQFMPQLPGSPAAITTGEKATQGADPGGPVQPGQLPGQQPVGAPAAPAQPGGVTPKAPPAAAGPSGGIGQYFAPAGPVVPTPVPTQPTVPTTPASPPSPLPTPLNDFISTLPGRAKGGPVGIYDSGGWLPPNGIAINKSNSLEPLPVFNDAQWGTLNSIANRDVGQYDPSSSGGNTYNYGPRIDSVVVKDVQELESQMQSRSRIESMRHRGRP